MEQSILEFKSPLGPIRCLFQGQFLVEVSIGKRDVLSLADRAVHRPSGESSGNNDFLRELDAYFRGNLREFRQRFKFVTGTPFEQEIWRTLLEIPYGEVHTYQWLAKTVGRPKGARAVGQALGKNPLPIVVPCHRIIASNGSLGGYSCGVDIKRWLLEHEKGKW